MSTATVQSILVVDDERALANTLAAIMQRAGYKCTAAYSADDALQLLRETRPDLIISDVMMPVTNGVEFAVQASNLHPGIRILLLSGHAGTQDIVEVARLNGIEFDLVAKPIAPEELLAKIASILMSVRP
jgi:DNA-binding response OmpR family regulator